MGTLPSRGCSKPGCAARAVTAGRCAAHARQHRVVEPTSNGYYQSDEWRSLRSAQLSRYPWCAEHLKRGQFVAAKVADHVRRRRVGGADALGNLQSLCWPCHQAKRGKERHA